MLRSNDYFLTYAETLASSDQGGSVVLKTFPAGTRFVKQDTHIRQIYILIEGISKCYRSEDIGKDFILAFLGKGEVIGDLEAIRKTKCLCNVEAISTVRAYAIPQDQFCELLRTDIAFNSKMMEELAYRVSRTSARASFQQLYPIEYGLIKLLIIEKEQQLFSSKQDMADYLGITIRSLNRTMKQLRDKTSASEKGPKPELSKKELEELLHRFE